MAGWRSVALAAVGTAVSVVAGPAIGLEPWAGGLISVIVALFWYVAVTTPARDDDEMDRWVVLTTYGTVHEAYVIRSALEASDIPCLMPEEHTAGARSELVIAMQGVRVMVPASELERARDLLRSGDPRRAH
jgi:hypothetical protein